MNSIIGAIQNTVPISMFNRGAAGQIFNEVRQSGAKVVMKNNVAECVLLSPEEYIQLTDELNDAKLALAAMGRMAHYDPEKVVSQEEIDREFGFTPEVLEAAGDVEIE